MGLFNKKAKEYSLAEVKKLIMTGKCEEYIAVPVNPDNPNTNYKLVLEKPAMQQEREKRMHRKQASDFMDRINGNGAYKQLENINYNNYQQAKGYKKAKDFGTR